MGYPLYHRERLFRLHASLRRLTVAAFNVSENDMITGDFGGKQTARDEDAIRRLAVDPHVHIRNKEDFRNVVLYMDPIGGGGGHAGERALLALSKGLGIDLAMVQELDVRVNSTSMVP